MRKIKRIVQVLAGFFIFYGIAATLNFLYMAEGDSRIERDVWNDFYKNQGKISYLYLGSSHVYCDINPFMLDERNGQFNFDLATPGQLMDGTYYLLREADRENNLSNVYIELYYYVNVKENFNHREEPVKQYSFRNWTILDDMKFSYNKFDYFRQSTQLEQWPDAILGFVRYRSKISDWGYIRNNVIQKCDPERKYKSEDFSRGYVPRNGVYQEQERLFMQEHILGEEPMAKTSEEYLRKAITYCQQREIPVTLFISPIYELQLISTEDYDNYVDQVRQIAEEYQVDFYDFNLVKEEYLPIQQMKYFSDVGHLNEVGSNLFTDFFWQVVSGNTSHNQKYFYDSYEQKLHKQKPMVYGLYYRISEDNIRNIWIASNKGTEMEYRITCRPNEGEQYTVQDFHVNKEFTLDMGEQGTCVITYRIFNMPDTEQTIEIVY